MPYLPLTNLFSVFFFFQAEDGIRDTSVTGVQTCALPILFPQRSTGLADTFDNLVLHVRDVRYVRQLVTFEFEIAPDKIGEDKRAEIANEIGRASCRERV